jgi:sialate O-acetylesterase
LRLYHSEVGAGWQQATPETLRQFSAQLFYFGMLLQKELDVPVGLMEGAVRGSPTANWISADVVESNPGIRAAIANWEKYHPYAEAEKRYRQTLAQWEKTVASLPAGARKPDKPWGAPPAGYTRGPRGDFYDKHIRPMIPFAIRGVLWDQGEGGTNIYGVGPDVAMRALIRSWRADWGQGDFAFLYVQKPSGGGCALNPDDPVNRGADAFAPLPSKPPQSRWDAEPLLSYIRIAENPNVFMVPTSDLVPGVHPPNKSGYATRDCRVALGAVYGKKDVEYSGPVYHSSKVEGNSMRISFTHIGRGLAVPRGQPLQGFEIAGADKRFRWADARIDGPAVVVSSPQVPAPVAVRYAWYWAIPWANLFNRDGLPAITFRTDSW